MSAISLFLIGSKAVQKTTVYLFAEAYLGWSEANLLGKVLSVYELVPFGL